MRTLIATLTLTLLAGPLAAQGWIEPLPNVLGGGVSRVRTAVHVTVTGRIALVEVEEWFRNDGGILGEGDYVYPLPGEAVFSNFSLFQGDQELRGETMNADEARAIYEEIVRKKRDPALIELVGHGMIRARVFPINPGDTRKITLRYTQVMNRAGDALQFRYTAGSRRSERPVPLQDGVPVRRTADSAPLSFLLTAEDGDAFRDPFSPTHRVRVDREDGTLRVRPETDLTGNFALFLPLARGLVGMTVVMHKPSSEPGYFMLTLSPGNPEGGGGIEPRDITVVVDVSGSMSGEKLEQSKAAIRQVLGSLDERDRFRLIAFSNMVRSQSEGWVRASRRNLREARRWVDGLQANGGTNIAGALEEAFRLESPTRRLPIVLFLTDGIPSVGEQNPERIAQQAESARGRARVFAFGVGYDVNTYLLDRLSAAGRGATEYVEPAEDVEQAVGMLTAKIQHPVLTDLELDNAPVQLTEIHPIQLPDLFSGEELIVFGRYQAVGRHRTGALSMHGQRSGRTERFSTDVSFPSHELGNDFIPRLWASRKLGHLARQIRIEGHSADLEREIRETALRYGLLSEYTSYLVLEPGMMVSRDTRLQQPRNSAMAIPVAQRASGAASAVAGAVGRQAVRAAEKSRARREIALEADLNEMEDRAAFSDTDENAKVSAGRIFVLRDGVWTDVTHHDSLPVVEIELYSSTYFELLRALPELEHWFKTFENVLVAGTKTSIKTVSSGATALEGRALERLVREFRGR
ncbi:MAG: VWA domain-containing protein [Gemmatimonadetes bacterium]|nr:VWA domain-containing protein [Gemmatimonadota bacterium]